MKLWQTFLLTATFGLAVQANAIETVEADDHSCRELKSMVRSEGALRIEVAPLLIETFYAEEPACSAHEVPTRDSWVWSDTGPCRPGWSCADIRERY